MYYHHEIRESLATLLGDACYWLGTYETYPPDELAVRFHHRLVSVHPFANGNGRHARLMADVLAQRQDRPVFTWGGADLGPRRMTFVDVTLTRYRAADAQDIGPLLAFARS